MRRNPRYSSTPFYDTSKVRLWIVIILRAFSYLFAFALSLGAFAAGVYLWALSSYSKALELIILFILCLIDFPIVYWSIRGTESIIQAWADRYYARLEYLEHNETNREHKARPAHDKATLTMLYLAGFLFPSNERLAALGDMDERFNLTKDKFGALWANGYLAYDICCTFLVKTAPFIKRLVKVLSLTSLASFLIWLVNQLEFVRELYAYVFHR